MAVMYSATMYSKQRLSKTLRSAHRSRAGSHERNQFVRVKDLETLLNTKNVLSFSFHAANSPKVQLFAKRAIYFLEKHQPVYMNV